jgi:hypothetical protein
MTENIKLFIAKNSKYKVITGMRVNADKKECKTFAELNTSAGILYKFDDRKDILLTPEDIKSAPEFTPDWAMQ